MVKKWKVTIPRLSGEKHRRAYIYLPNSYSKDADQRYPVLYMFDGHNVFFDQDATYGKSWGMKSFMDRTKKDLIIVAVECNHEGNKRLQEYCPFNFESDDFGKIRGRGSVYMNWLTEELKPWVDRNYRTLPDREHTFIAGSSMGGLMSLYALCAYPRVFSGAACLSPSLWTSPTGVLEMIAKAKFGPDTVAYLDYGSQEMDNHGASASILTGANQMLLAKGVYSTLRIVPGGNHSEASWEKQIPIFMDCLGL